MPVTTPTAATGGKKSEAVEKIRKINVYTVTWLSFVTAVPAGFAWSITFIGDWIRGIVGIFPDPVAPIVAAVVFFAVVLDVIWDLIPNRKAVWGALTFPSLGGAIHGEIGVKLKGWGDLLNAWTDKHMDHWIGQSGTVLIAGMLTALALVAARKAFRKSNDTASTGAGRFARTGR